MDREVYRKNIQLTLSNYDNLYIGEGSVGDLLINDNNTVEGIVTEDEIQIRSKRVILTTGFCLFLYHISEYGMNCIKQLEQ